MDKIKVEYKAPEKTTVIYNETEIEIYPNLDMIQQTGLINRYVNDYFSINEDKLVTMSPYNYLEAEYNLMVYFLQTVTNIDVESFVVDLVSDAEFWTLITDSVPNYYDFRSRLDRVISEIREERKIQRSLGFVVDNALVKLFGILDEFKKLNPKDIERMQKQGESLLKELTESSLKLAPDVSKKVNEKK